MKLERVASLVSGTLEGEGSTEISGVCGCLLYTSDAADE